MKAHRLEEQGAHKHEKEADTAREQTANLEQQNGWGPSAKKKILLGLTHQPEEGQTLSQR